MSDEKRSLLLTHLKLGPHRAIQELRLEDLGQVSVLTGRNASGKTTILEAIANEATRRAGRRADSEFVLSMTRALSEASTVPSVELQKIVGDVAGRKVSWYVDEAGEFAGAFWSAARTIVRGNVQEQAFRAYQSLFPAELRTALTPPKRVVETPFEISTSAGVSTTGLGVLNALFYAQTQLPASRENSLNREVRRAFAEITSGLEFEIVARPDNRAELMVSTGAGRHVPASESGLGIRDLIVHLYFAAAPDLDLVLIEEPENHLHPDMQRKLLSYLSGRTDRQFILSTHSNVFLDPTYVDKIYLVKYAGNVTADDATSRSGMLSDLGYSVADNLLGDLVVLVEGSSDVPVLQEFLHKMGLMSRYRIKFWPLGGDAMAQVDLQVVADTYKVIALVDGDPGSAKIRKDFEELCASASIDVVKLSRRAIENYFSIDALRKVFGGQIGSHVTSLDPNTRVRDQLHFEVKRNNRQIARLMTLEALHGTDLMDFLTRVETLLESEH